MPGYSPILELGDGPLTPRENLTRPIVGIENRTAHEVFDIMSDRFRAHLTALASGSGDHAELARDLRAFEGSDGLGNGDFTVCEFAADALETLLAENAALRDSEKAALKECSDWARQAGEATGKLEASEMAGVVEDWRDRATEAERKLAEAVGLLEDYLIGQRMDSSPLRDRVSTFLSSKESRD